MRSARTPIYRILYDYFGPQHWWPADTPFEVMVGAILTQNTNWSNVEKAIHNLKEHYLLAPRKMHSLTHQALAALIKPAGYYNNKAKRLKHFLDFFKRAYRLSLARMSRRGTPQLREELLCVNGIGPETADSILLYALQRPVFVVDAYTKRILLRHRLIRDDADYYGVQKLFMENIKTSVQLFQEYHALFVRLGKEFCTKTKPKCQKCPLYRRRINV